jgi:hypothetical protein
VVNNDRSTSYMSAEDLARLKGRSSISKRDNGYEIVFSSAHDDALTFFVTLPKARMNQTETLAAPTEPE